MVQALVTGARGFLGQNLCVVLRQCAEVELSEIDIDDPAASFDGALDSAEIVFHLAGVNRPRDPADFEMGNARLTERVCDRLRRSGHAAKIVLTSSIQAERDNPYGLSKRHAEESVARYSAATGAAGVVFRLKNLFGKWCRPNYNAVTATFCHNIARDLPIDISDSAHVVDLTYVDDVVSALASELVTAEGGYRLAQELPSQRISLGELAALLQSFRRQRESLLVPDFSKAFVRALYATYLSYLPEDAFAYPLTVRADARGSLAELLKQPSFGQVFVSRTKPGATRGNHYHHTKTEKFIVVEGDALVRLRHIFGEKVVEHRVSAEDYRVVDIPPGYTHSIENVGATELVTLFWSSELFDPERPDTSGLFVVPKGTP